LACPAGFLVLAVWCGLIVGSWIGFRLVFGGWFGGLESGQQGGDFVRHYRRVAGGLAWRRGGLDRPICRSTQPMVRV
jgi:hypothetical protein